MYALEPIKKLAKLGFNGVALLEIERAAFMQAVASRPQDASHEHIFKDALESLPRGEIHLLVLYTQQLALLENADVRRLQILGRELSTRAAFLENRYAELVDGSLKGPLSMPMYTQMRGQIADSYANLIQAAEDLTARGVIPMASKRLEALTEPLDGPLKDLHPKAMAILASRRATHRQAMRA